MEENIKKSTAMLTLLMLFRKLLSIVYKIPYQNVTGDAGFYVFQQIYPFIAVSMLLTGFALPTVVGSLLAEHHYSTTIKDKLKRAMWLFALLIFSVLFLGNRQIALILGDVLLAPIIRIASIHFLFIAPISYLRGVLQSRPKTMEKLGYSVMVEQITRVFAILIVLYIFGSNTANSAYRIAELAFGFSLISPVITLAHLFLLNPEDDIQSFLPLTEKTHFFRRALYLFCGAGILVIFGVIDSFLIFNTLITTESQSASMTLVGIYERGLPIIQAGTFFVSSLVALTMSRFEVAKSDKQKKDAFSTGLFFVLGLAIPATVGLRLVAPYLNRALFTDQAGNSTLQIMMLQVVLYALVVLLTATLSRTEKQSFVLFSLLIGIVTKFFLTMPLVSHFGIDGAALSSVASLAVMNLIMLLAVKHLVTFKLIASVTGIVVSTFVMWAVLVRLTPVFAGLNNGERQGYLLLLLINTFLGIVLYALVLGLLIYVFNAIGKRVLTHHRQRVERVQRIVEERRRIEEERRMEALRLEEEERERYRQSLMHNKPKVAVRPTVNEHLDGRGHSLSPSVPPAPVNTTPVATQHQADVAQVQKRKKGSGSMRLDKFLKVSRIIKRRQTAKEVSDAGKISVNGKVAKSSTSLSIGDEIALHYATRTLTIRVVEIKDSTKKEDAQRMYEVVSEVPRG